MFKDYQYRVDFVLDGEHHSRYAREWDGAITIAIWHNEWRIMRLSDKVVLSESVRWYNARKAVCLVGQLLAGSQNG